MLIQRQSIFQCFYSNAAAPFTEAKEVITPKKTKKQGWSHD